MDSTYGLEKELKVSIVYFLLLPCPPRRVYDRPNVTSSYVDIATRM